jgi:photosystem II stability/assembly factor-like uncharacterized protein
MKFFRHAALTGLILSSACAAAAAAPAAAGALKPVPAPRSSIASQAMILGSAKAGQRLVGVGEQGIVLLSDDGGKSVRQAKAVPVSSTLTAVSFVDDQRGWAVGHWGVVLSTVDGGETWQLQRLAAEEDRPLFSVHFFDDRHGVAVGLWSLVLTTQDGGKTWATQALTPPQGAKKADLNLLQLFADKHGKLYAAAERGMVLRSADQGRSWDYLDTGYKGSFWSGSALEDGSLLVGGQRGALYRSTDGGAQWTRVESGSKSSVTSISERPGEVIAVGLDGLVAKSADHGQTFTARVRDDKLSLTSAQPLGSGRWAIWSRRGLATDPLPAVAGTAR